MDDSSERRLLQSNVVEQSLPGIGRRYELRCEEGGDIVVVVHNSGRRDLYVLDHGADEPRAAMTMSDAQARTIGAVLAGAYYKPAVVEEIETVLGRLLIDWFTLREDSPGAGKTIAEMEIRRQTRMTVAAILRDGDPLIAPEPTEVLRAGDRLVVVGRQEDRAGFVRHVVGRDG